MGMFPPRPSATPKLLFRPLLRRPPPREFMATSPDRERGPTFFRARAVPSSSSGRLAITTGAFSSATGARAVGVELTAGLLAAAMAADEPASRTAGVGDVRGAGAPPLSTVTPPGEALPSPPLRGFGAETLGWYAVTTCEGTGRG